MEEELLLKQHVEPLAYALYQFLAQAPQRTCVLSREDMSQTGILEGKSIFGFQFDYTDPNTITIRLVPRD